mgnify:CR=1 FL=1
MSEQRDYATMKSIGLLMLENIQVAGLFVPESMLPEFYEKALQEYTDLAANIGRTSFEGTPELKQKVMDDVRYFLERKGYLK